MNHQTIKHSEVGQTNWPICVLEIIAEAVIEWRLLGPEADGPVLGRTSQKGAIPLAPHLGRTDVACRA
ncbi:MAG: hypothetical protein JF620_04935 [Mesorhizobium sp.]|nr:hypothetical protein [Mesorhizobium sp.]